MSTANSVTVTTASQTQATAASGAGDATYRWLVAWGIMIAVLIGINKTRLGHVAIYYALWLALIFLLVTQYKFIANALGPLGSPAPTTGQK